MIKTDTTWYETMGDPAAFKNAVQCETYAAALSLEELAEVRIHCRVPMTKAVYQIKMRKGAIALEGEHLFENGTETFLLKDILPLPEMKPFETKESTYQIGLTITLINGVELSGFRVFECSLRPGKTATKMPTANLAERLQAIPIAKPGMTEEELRQICIDYMKLENEFCYRFPEDFVYTIESQKRSRRLLAGKVYGGLPYVTRGAGNLYRVAEFIDPKTGMLDLSGDIFQNIRHFGNACSGSACMAWARVVTSAYLGYTMFLTHANGFLPVGPYRYSQPNVTKFIKKRIDPKGYTCEDICRENGEQTMFESYAQMKPADGVGCCGHVRMNTALPYIVRKADGTIDGEQSYTLMTEQVCYVPHPNHIRITPEGDHYTAQGYVDVKYSFKELFDTHYIPFTFAEFQDPSRVQEAKIRLSVEPMLSMETLSSNYPISDVFCELNGQRYTFRNEEFFRKEMKLAEIFPAQILTNEAKISCRLYNGEILEVDTRR